MSIPEFFADGKDQPHKYDGSEVFWRPTIHGLAVQEKSLFVIRPFGSPLFEPPGGKIELGETAESALEREFLEEAGYEATVVRLIGFGEKWLFHTREKRYYHMLMQFWEVNVGRKVREPSDPHEFAGFVPLDQLDALSFHEVLQPLVRTLQENT